MTTYNLNLNKNYCNHWGIWEAVREIIQNGLDQQTINPDNTIGVDYNPKNKMLSITSKGSVLERKTLLLGASSKSEDKNTIGQFGEGYKIALLVLTKMGINVVIKNYAANEKWIPSLKADRSYDGEEVLKVKVQKYIFKKLPDHNLSFEISGVTKQQWALIKENYLYKQENVSCHDSRRGSQLLLDDKHKGMVFINGLFVEKMKGDFEFGYNFSPRDLTLDRDRQSIRNWEFQSVSGLLVDDFLKKVEDDQNKVLRVKNAIKNKKNDFNVPVYNLPCNTTLSRSFVKDLELEYGNFAYPVSSQKEADTITRLHPSVKPVYVDEKTRAIISRLHEYKSIKNFIEYKGISNDDDESHTPKMELELFLIEHSECLSFEAKIAFEDLIKKSELWINTKKNLNKETELELIKESSKEKEKVELEEFIVEPEKFVDPFDDDIPF